MNFVMVVKRVKPRQQRFAPRIVEELARALAIKVAAANTEMRMSPDEHQAELVVQSMIRLLIQPHIPCASLLEENKKILDHPELGELIPDVIIHRIGGGIWGLIELKTMLKSDKLPVGEVERDLAKLISYKVAHPQSAPLFILVGSWSKLFHANRLKSWGALKIRYEPDTFQVSSAAPQRLNEDYVAIPAGSFTVRELEIACFIWEIQTNANADTRISQAYDFTAAMTAASSGNDQLARSAPLLHF